MFVSSPVSTRDPGSGLVGWMLASFVSDFYKVALDLLATLTVKEGFGQFIVSSVQ